MNRKAFVLIANVKSTISRIYVRDIVHFTLYAYTEMDFSTFDVV